MRVKHERVQRGQEPRESVVEAHSCILSIQSRRWFVLVPFHCTQVTSAVALFNFPAEIVNLFLSSLFTRRLFGRARLSFADLHTDKLSSFHVVTY